MEGVRRPPPTGVGYQYTTPKHIADLRTQAIKRYNDIEVEQLPLSYSGYFSKAVFKIKQGRDQIQRAINGAGGATKISLVPNGELIQTHVDNYLVIHIEPLSLPHRHIVSPYINHLLTEPAKGVRPTTSASASTTTTAAQPRARQQQEKKKKAAEDVSYVHNKKITIENKDYNTREKTQAGTFKRIQLSKKQEVDKQKQN